MMRQSKTAIIIFSLLLGVFILHFTKIITPIEDLMRGVLAPIGSLATSIGIVAHKQVDGIGRDKACIEQNEELLRQLQHLSIDYVQLQALKEENAILRKTLGFVEQQGYDAVAAHIISRSVAPDRDYFMIDRGAKDGLELGMAVIFGDGIYVGKITKIYDRTAVVTLTTDPDSRVAISLSGEHRLIGLVEGKGNGTALATLIPQEEEIQMDDILVTSGTEEKIPSDLLVGVVNQILDESTDPFKEATLEPVVQTDYLNIVAVLRPGVLRPE